MERTRRMPRCCQIKYYSYTTEICLNWWSVRYCYGRSKRHTENTKPLLWSTGGPPSPSTLNIASSATSINGLILVTVTDFKASNIYVCAAFVFRSEPVHTYLQLEHRHSFPDQQKVISTPHRACLVHLPKHL